MHAASAGAGLRDVELVVRGRGWRVRQAGVEAVAGNALGGGKLLANLYGPAQETRHVAVAGSRGRAGTGGHRFAARLWAALGARRVIQRRR